VIVAVVGEVKVSELTPLTEVRVRLFAEAVAPSVSPQSKTRKWRMCIPFDKAGHMLDFRGRSVNSVVAFEESAAGLCRRRHNSLSNYLIFIGRAAYFRD
jgi:hypothetical protein